MSPGDGAPFTAPFLRAQKTRWWPFPASIMFGFRARAKSFDLAARDDELADVQWFTRDDVRGFGERSDPGEGFKLPNRTAIARHLIEGWLSE